MAAFPTLYSSICFKFKVNDMFSSLNSCRFKVSSDLHRSMFCRMGNATGDFLTTQKLLQDCMEYNI